jgi:UDP-N-acetylglucosamine 1-carboxyvinyltransferase
MDAIRVRGARELRGTIRVGGAKNAALPILCATLLSDGESLLRNVPGLRDIETTGELLRTLGRDVTVGIPEVRVHAATREVVPEAPYDLVRQMRASVLVLGTATSWPRPRACAVRRSCSTCRRSRAPRT